MRLPQITSNRYTIKPNLPCDIIKSRRKTKNIKYMADLFLYLCA